MAANSIREQIVLGVVSSLEELSSISTVARKKLGKDELSSVADTQMPYAVVTAGLPVPELKPHGRTRDTVDKFRSNLTVSIIVYGRDNVSPDSTISSICDDIWAKIYSDPRRGNLALTTIVNPVSETGIFDPYYAFSVDLFITYIHGSGSI